MPLSLINISLAQWVLLSTQRLSLGERDSQKGGREADGEGHRPTASQSVWARGWRNVAISRCKNTGKLCGESFFNNFCHDTQCKTTNDFQTRTSWNIDATFLSLSIAHSDELQFWMRYVSSFYFFLNFLTPFSSLRGAGAWSQLGVAHLSCWMPVARGRCSSTFTPAGRWLALKPLTESLVALGKSGKPPDCLWPVEVRAPKLAKMPLNTVEVRAFESHLIRRTFTPTVFVNTTHILIWTPNPDRWL